MADSYKRLAQAARSADSNCRAARVRSPTRHSRSGDGASAHERGSTTRRLD